MKLIEAVGELRLRSLQEPERDTAVEALIRIALRQQAALRFYADARNWDSAGICWHEAIEQEPGEPDEGWLAQQALAQDLDMPKERPS